MNIYKEMTYALHARRRYDSLLIPTKKYISIYESEIRIKLSYLHNNS